MVRKSWIWRDFSITVKIFFDIFLIKTFPDWCDKSHLFFAWWNIWQIWENDSLYLVSILILGILWFVNSYLIFQFMIIFVTVIQQKFVIFYKRNFAFRKKDAMLKMMGLEAWAKTFLFTFSTGNIYAILLLNVYLWFS